MLMLRRLLALVAVLTLTLSGLAQAAATVHGPVNELVICGDGGPKTIRLDAQGNPVEGDQCCDCLQCLVLTATPAVDVTPVALPAGLVQAEPRLPDATRAEPARHTRPMPRGPPVATLAVDATASQSGPFSAAFEFGQVRRGKVVAAGGQPPKVAR